MNIIISNQRDQLAFDYLKKVVGEASINKAVELIAGERKPYISNVAKILNIKIPDDLQPLGQSEIAKEHLAKIRAMLNK